MNACPHCNSHLRDFWWETQIPQAKWTAEQHARTQARQEALRAYKRYSEGFSQQPTNGRDP